MSKLLGNCKRGLVFIISAPAGTGKTTLVDMLEKEFPFIVRSISYTTRPKRVLEKDNEHYHFVTTDEFERRIAQEEFLEHVLLYGHYYGTSKITVQNLQEEGKHVILVIDTQGAMALKEHFPAIYIFIKPPSLDVLEKRLKERRTESNEVIHTRLEWAKKELQLSSKYDYEIVNDDLSTAYDVLKSIIIAEEHRIR